MCNLYSMTRNREAILRLFRISDNRAAAYEPQSAIFPGYQAPVVRKAADGERELVVLNWGFVLLQNDRAPKRVTNMRDDKAQTKFWRPSFEQRRCLVPASSYCEPKGEKPAMWHWFSVNGDDARPVFAFPGVWTRYKGPLKKNGDIVEQEVFALISTLQASGFPTPRGLFRFCCLTRPPQSALSKSLRWEPDCTMRIWLAA